MINSSLREGMNERQAFRREKIRCYPVTNFLSGSDRGLNSRFIRSFDTLLIRRGKAVFIDK